MSQLRIASSIPKSPRSFEDFRTIDRELPLATDKPKYGWMGGKVYLLGFETCQHCHFQGARWLAWRLILLPLLGEEMLAQGQGFL